MTNARQNLNALVRDAQNGRMTHIVSGGTVVAHLVPPDTPIVERPWEHAKLFRPAIECEARRGAAERAQKRSITAGETVGQILEWAWRTDRGVFVDLTVRYVAVLKNACGEPIDLSEVEPALMIALMQAGMPQAEIEQSLAYARDCWDDWPQPVIARNTRY